MQLGTKRLTGIFVTASCVWFVACSTSDADVTPEGSSSAAEDGGTVSNAEDAGFQGDGAPGALPDGASPDAGEAGPPKGCTALFCDDFESGAIDVAKWERLDGYGPPNTVTIQTTKVAHGTHAARAHVKAQGGGFAFLKETKTFPALADGLWARAYVYISVDPTVGHHAFSKVGRMEIGESSESVQLTFYPQAGGENPSIYDSAKIPHDAWQCLEWHVSKTSPQIQVYRNGALIASYTYSGGSAVPSLDAFSIGLETHVSTPSENDFYFDDVAIDGQRVGCLP